MENQKEWTLKITVGGKGPAKIEGHHLNPLELMSAICGMVQMLKDEWDLDEKFVFELVETSYFMVKEQLMKN